MKRSDLLGLTVFEALQEIGWMEPLQFWEARLSINNGVPTVDDLPTGTFLPIEEFEIPPTDVEFSVFGDDTGSLYVLSRKLFEANPFGWFYKRPEMFERHPVKYGSSVRVRPIISEGPKFVDNRSEEAGTVTVSGPEEERLIDIGTYRWVHPMYRAGLEVEYAFEAQRRRYFIKAVEVISDG